MSDQAGTSRLPSFLVENESVEDRPFQVERGPVYNPGSSSCIGGGLSLPGGVIRVENGLRRE